MSYLNTNNHSFSNTNNFPNTYNRPNKKKDLSFYDHLMICFTIVFGGLFIISKIATQLFSIRIVEFNSSFYIVCGFTAFMISIVIFLYLLDKIKQELNPLIKIVMFVAIFFHCILLSFGCITTINALDFYNKEEKKVEFVHDIDSVSRTYVTSTKHGRKTSVSTDYFVLTKPEPTSKMVEIKKNLVPLSVFENAESYDFFVTVTKKGLLGCKHLWGSPNVVKTHINDEIRKRENIKGSKENHLFHESKSRIDTIVYYKSQIRDGKVHIYEGWYENELEKLQKEYDNYMKEYETIKTKLYKEALDKYMKSN